MYTVFHLRAIYFHDICEDNCFVNIHEYKKAANVSVTHRFREYT